MTPGKNKCFYHSYDTNIAVGKPVKFTGGSIIPVVSITGVYGGATRCTGGGCVIFDPLALFVVQENNLEICLIKQKKYPANYSSLFNLAAELFG